MLCSFFENQKEKSFFEITPICRRFPVAEGAEHSHRYNLPVSLLITGSFSEIYSQLLFPFNWAETSVSQKRSRSWLPFVHVRRAGHFKVSRVKVQKINPPFFETEMQSRNSSSRAASDVLALQKIKTGKRHPDQSFLYVFRSLIISSKPDLRLPYSIPPL